MIGIVGLGIGSSSKRLHYYRFDIGEMTGLKGETFSSANITRIQDG